jgi:predicted lipid-binding transport protein (Tim44 family)
MAVAPGVEQGGGAAKPLPVPGGFDAAGFLRAAKLNFVKLQVANDAGQLEEIREFTTGEMFDELRKDALARPSEPQQTDVVSLNADLLEVASEKDRHWASVRFSGLVREMPGTAPVGFEEVWNLVKPADGSSGWLLAGIQQMH